MAALLALLALLINACGGGAGTPAASTAHAPTNCGKDCRIYRGEPPAVPECRVPEDCGSRPHIQTMQCIAGGRCIPVCEHHWGDCDEEFRNGCEQAIADRHYCPGDQRIGASSEPSVSFFVRDDQGTSTDVHRKDLTRALEAEHAELSRCYRALLSRQPGLAGESTYRITFAESGAGERIERLASAAADPTLTQCEERALRAAKIKPGERGGRQELVVEIVFAPGGPDAEAE